MDLYSHLLFTPQFGARMSALKPAPTPAPDCLSGWQDHHTTDFAVSLERNIYEERLVSAHANCIYRKYFGRENQAGQKRAKTKNVRVFTAPFRTDTYAQHHRAIEKVLHGI